MVRDIARGHANRLAGLSHYSLGIFVMLSQSVSLPGYITHKHLSQPTLYVSGLRHLESDNLRGGNLIQEKENALVDCDITPFRSKTSGEALVAERYLSQRRSRQHRPRAEKE